MGMSEEQAIESGIPYTVKKVSVNFSGRHVAENGMSQGPRRPPRLCSGPDQAGNSRLENRKGKSLSRCTLCHFSRKCGRRKYSSRNCGAADKITFSAKGIEQWNLQDYH